MVVHWVHSAGRWQAAVAPVLLIDLLWSSPGSPALKSSPPLTSFSPRPCSRPAGAPWPAWSRATAASLSSAPPPPPPATRSPAPWSPGRSQEPKTKDFAPIKPWASLLLPFFLVPPSGSPTSWLPAHLSSSLLIVFGLCSSRQASLFRTDACLHKQKTKI